MTAGRERSLSRPFAVPAGIRSGFHPPRAKESACCPGRPSSPDGSTSTRSSSRAAARQPARRPARAAAGGVRPAGLRRRAGAALPVRLRDPGLHRPRRRCGTTGRRGGGRSPSWPTSVFARGDAPPAIVVYVDAWTSVGGSQFLDSPGTGRYHSYLCDEVVPWVDAHYRTLADRDHRAITGKSSGGYGAMITPMLRPDLFGALATHAGDALFDVCYRTDFPNVARDAARHLRRRSRCDERFLADFRGRIAGTKKSDIGCIELYGYAACYSADEDGDRTPALRRHRSRCIPDDLGPLAGLGPRAHGRAAGVRRGAALAEGDLDRRGHPGRVLPRLRRRGVPARDRGGGGARRRPSTSSCSTPGTAPSSTAIRSPWRGSPSASVPDLPRQARTEDRAGPGQLDRAAPVPGEDGRRPGSARSPAVAAQPYARRRRTAAAADRPRAARAAGRRRGVTGGTPARASRRRPRRSAVSGSTTPGGLGLERRDRQEFGHVDVLGREPGPQHVVRAGHQLDPGAAEVGVRAGAAARTAPAPARDAPRSAASRRSRPCRPDSAPRARRTAPARRRRPRPPPSFGDGQVSSASTAALQVSGLEQGGHRAQRGHAAQQLGALPRVAQTAQRVEVASARRGSRASARSPCSCAPGRRPGPARPRSRVRPAPGPGGPAGTAARPPRGPSAGTAAAARTPPATPGPRAASGSAAMRSPSACPDGSRDGAAGMRADPQLRLRPLGRARAGRGSRRARCATPRRTPGWGCRVAPCQTISGS